MRVKVTFTIDLDADDWRKSIDGKGRHQSIQQVAQAVAEAATEQWLTEKRVAHRITSARSQSGFEAGDKAILATTQESGVVTSVLDKEHVTLKWDGRDIEAKVPVSLLIKS